MAHKTYRVNADSTDVLVDLLVGTPEEFNSDKDKLRGRNYDAYLMGTGKLSGKELDAFISASRTKRITYVIYSYDTPIAWRQWGNDDQRWVLATGTGSMTTAKHMAKVRAAISRISNGITD
jgi:hypothetical protein